MSGMVVVVGSVNVDLTVAVPALPAPGETALGRRMERHGGGKGANAAVAAARAGAAVALVGAVGGDDLGAGALAELRDEGVDVDAVAVLDDEPTGTALIVVDERGENQIAVGAGANARVTAAAVERALRGRLDASGIAAGAVAPELAARPAGGCVLVSTEIPDPAVAAAVRTARDLRVRCVLNPAPARRSLLDLLDAGPVLTPNAGEARRLAGEADAAAAARALAARTGAEVVVTLGAEGALVVAPGGAEERVPARPARAVDTTGAGDTFNGALAARLAAGDPLAAAVRAAADAASRSVEVRGARG